MTLIKHRFYLTFVSFNRRCLSFSIFSVLVNLFSMSLSVTNVCLFYERKNLLMLFVIVFPSVFDQIELNQLNLLTVSTVWSNISPLSCHIELLLLHSDEFVLDRLNFEVKKLISSCRYTVKAPCPVPRSPNRLFLKNIKIDFLFCKDGGKVFVCW